MDPVLAQLQYDYGRNKQQFFPAALTTGADIQAALYAGGFPTVTAGVGSPEGVVTANRGSEYTDYSDPTAPIKWTKGDGTGNTGWIS